MLKRVAQSQRSPVFDTVFRGLLAVSLYLAFPAFSDIYRLWERYAGNPAFAPSPFEYPPGSFVYYQPLQLLPSSRWAVAVNGLLMVAAAAGVTRLLMRRRRLREDGDVDVSLWALSPSLLILLPINWDVAVALFALIGFVALVEGRYAASGGWLGVGTATKVFPGAFVVPMLPLIEDNRRRATLLGMGLLGIVLPYGLYALLEPSDWRFHLEFAAERTDIESSIWGVIDEAARLVGFDFRLETINWASTVALVIALALITWWASRTKPEMARVAALSLLAFIFFNKVFKPQYVLWVIPFLALTRVSRSKTRLFEATALAHFAFVYLLVPPVALTGLAVIRTAALGALVVDLVRRRRPAVSVPG